MTQDTNSEYLSARLDGELTPDERQVIDARLEESESLRAELAELERMSSLLAELPTEAAPAGIRENVLSRLAPAMAAAPSSSPRRWRGAAAMVTAALALFAMFRLLPEQRDGAQEDASPAVARTVSSEADDSAGSLPAPAETTPAETTAAETTAAESATPLFPSASSDTAVAGADAPSADPATATAAQPVDRGLSEFADSIRGDVVMFQVRSRGDVRKRLERALSADDLVPESMAAAPSLADTGRAAVYVRVRFDQLESVLGHIEDETGPDSLFLYRVRSRTRAELEARLTAALESDDAAAKTGLRVADAGTTRFGGKPGDQEAERPATDQRETAVDKKVAGGRVPGAKDTRRRKSRGAPAPAGGRRAPDEIRLVFVVDEPTVNPQDPCEDGSA